jgi:hypothetical protein
METIYFSFVKQNLSVRGSDTSLVKDVYLHFFGLACPVYVLHCDDSCYNDTC